MGQLKTMSIILEAIPQFLLHLYVLYVVSGSAEKEELTSNQPWSIVPSWIGNAFDGKHNYTQINKSFDEAKISFDWSTTLFISFSIAFTISARKVIMVKLLLSIRSFVVDFSTYKRTTLELHKIKCKKEIKGPKVEEENKTQDNGEEDKKGQKEGDLWQSRNFSVLMIRTAKWTDNITQFIFFTAKAMLLIWACTHGLMIEYTVMGGLKTLAFYFMYNQG